MGLPNHAKNGYPRNPFLPDLRAEAVVPIEVGLPSPRMQNLVATTNEEELRCNLDMLKSSARKQRY